MATPYRVVLITVPDRKTAEKIQNGLVERKLAACVNAVPGVSSVYRWEDKIEKTEEILLLCKTRAALTPELAEFVRKNHPASVPEIISLAIETGNKPYLDWLGANTIFAKRPPSANPHLQKE
ncbi:MAG: divalent-cation tolerance protein CutA [Elusimicrobiota bacterium]